MTETAADKSSPEPSALEPFAINTQLASDHPVKKPEPDTSEPAPAEPSGLSGEPTPAAVLQAMEGDKEIQEIKSTMLDSAGLANQAANHALKAGDDLQQATENLINLYATQRKLGVIVLVSCGTLMVIAMVLFVFMSSSLQQRIAQADAMLLAVGKRIVTMNESVEIISGTGDILRNISSNQSAISGQQIKLDGRLDEVLRATQNAVVTPSKDSKAPDISKLLQAMELQIQGNSSAIKSLSAQLRSKPAANPDPVAIQREVEASLLRQQNKVPIPTPTAAANPTSTKSVERLVQYPRAQSVPATAP